MTLAVLAFIGGFIAIPLVNSVALVVFFFALINCAYSVFSTVLKAWFADVLSPEKKAQIFSLNHLSQYWLDRWAAYRHSAGHAQY